MNTGGCFSASEQLFSTKQYHVVQGSFDGFVDNSRKKVRKRV
jgi:hypothetical protein